jgi:YD repeat-containing protein
MRRRLLLLMGAVGMVTTVPTQAATVLKFEGFACTGVDGGAVDRDCVNQNDLIGANFGSTAELAVSYDAAGNVIGGTDPATSLVYRFPPFGSGAASPTNPGNELSRIVFTPAAGFEVAFQGFNYTRGTATALFFFGELLDANNNVIDTFTGGTTGPAVNSGSFMSNTGYFSGPLTFRFGRAPGGSGVAVVNDIQFDVRAIQAGVVPEPATWAMMILGFGLIGSALRQRRPLVKLA